MELTTDLSQTDVPLLEQAARATGFFSDEEVGFVKELAEAALNQGAQSGYHFVLARESNDVLGFACFGPIPGTLHSHDLYWIVVDPAHQGSGVGRSLLATVEQEISTLGGKRLYADTSSRSQYAPTHRFYERCGFSVGAHLEDYYAPGDGRYTFVKVLSPTP